MQCMYTHGVGIATNKTLLAVLNEKYENGFQFQYMISVFSAHLLALLYVV